MAITEEMARAEIARRQQKQSSSGLTPEMAQNEIIRRQQNKMNDQLFQSPKENKQPDINEQLQQRHPFLYQLAEQIAKRPLMKKATDLLAQGASPIIKGTEQLGLPIIADHALSAPMAFASMLTGEYPRASTENVNPYIAEGAKGIGQAIDMISGVKIAGAGAKGIANMKGQSFQEKLKNSAQEMANVNRSMEIAKAKAGHEFGTTNPDRLQFKSEEMAENARQFTQQAEEMSKKFGGAVQPSELIESTAKGAAEKAKQNIRDFGGEGENYSTRINDAFMTHLRGEKNPITGRREHGLIQAIGKRYDVLSNTLKNQNVKMKHTPETKKLSKWAEKNFPNMSYDAKGKAVTEWAKQLSTNEDIDASKFLTGYRGLKQEIFKTKEKAYKFGQNSETQDALLEQAKTMQTKANTMQRVMDEQLGGNYLGELESINKQYSTYVAPLHKNPLYLAMKKGEITSNPLQQITQDIPGNKTLRMVFNKDPELQRLLFGKQYASSPEKLLRPNEIVKNLGEINPEIKNYVEELKTSHEKLEPALQHAKKVEEFEKLSKEIPRLQKDSQESQKQADEIRELMKDQTLTKEKHDQLNKKLQSIEKRNKNLKTIAKIHAYLKLFYTSPLAP